MQFMGSTDGSMQEKRPEMERSPPDVNPCKICTLNSKYEESYDHLKFTSINDIKKERLANMWMKNKEMCSAGESFR